MTREWFVIENIMAYGVFGSDLPKVLGYIPRDVAEAICGRTLNGGIWFTREQSEQMRQHPEWSDRPPKGAYSKITNWSKP